MTHDVFISYPSENKSVADAICAKLELKQIRCWIAPRDILPGQSYSQALLEAIDASKIFILVFSAETNTSPHIMSEVRNAFNHNIVIIPFRIDNIQPSRALEYYIGGPHWLDALTPPLEKHIDSLVNVVQKNLKVNVDEVSGPQQPPADSHSQENKKTSITHFGYAAIIGLLVIVCLSLVLNSALFSQKPETQPPITLAGITPVALVASSPVTAATTGMSTPASVYCSRLGGTIEIKTNSNGGQDGMCTFTNGTTCEEWALFRGEGCRGSR
jgi:putative hemolysin